MMGALVCLEVMVINLPGQGPIGACCSSWSVCIPPFFSVEPRAQDFFLQEPIFIYVMSHITGKFPMQIWKLGCAPGSNTADIVISDM